MFSSLTAVLFATSNVLSRLTHLKHGSYWEVYFAGSLVNLLVILPAVAYELHTGEVVTARDVIYAMGYGIVFTMLQSSLFSYAIRTCGSVVASTGSLSIEPLSASLLSVLIIGEKMTPYLALATLLMILVAYLLYIGTNKKSSNKHCGLKGYIGVFTGFWASVGAIVFSSIMLHSGIRPMTFTMLTFIPRLMILAPFIYIKNGFSFVFRMPRELYFSTILGSLGAMAKFQSLSYGVPARAVIIILMYVPLTVLLSHFIKSTREEINKYTVSAVIIAFLSAVLSTISR